MSVKVVAHLLNDTMGWSNGNDADRQVLLNLDVEKTIDDRVHCLVSVVNINGGAQINPIRIFTLRYLEAGFRPALSNEVLQLRQRGLDFGFDLVDVFCIHTVAPPLSTAARNRCVRLRALTAWVSVTWSRP